MKRMITVLCALFAALFILTAASSCEIKSGIEKKSKPYVVCTIFPQYDFVRNVVGDRMEIEMLVPLGTESHTFDIGKISMGKLNELSQADLLIYVGGESDKELASDLKGTLTRGTKFLALTDLVSELLCEEETGGMAIDPDEEEEEEEEGEEEFDEHVWTSPRRAVEIVNGLLPALCALDPANEEEFRANAADYIQKLNELDAAYEALAAGAKYKTAIFADRFPFLYLFRDYGLEADAAFQGCSASIDPSPAKLSYLYNKAKELSLPAVFYMEGSDPKYAENLAAKIGGKALLLHSCHVVSEKEFAETDYIGLQKQNIENLKIALGFTEGE